MRTALDTNILSLFWSGEPWAAAIADHRAGEDGDAKAECVLGLAQDYIFEVGRGQIVN